MEVMGNPFYGGEGIKIKPWRERNLFPLDWKVSLAQKHSFPLNHKSEESENRTGTKSQMVNFSKKHCSVRDPF